MNINTHTHVSNFYDRHLYVRVTHATHLQLFAQTSPPPPQPPRRRPHSRRRSPSSAPNTW